MAERSPEDIAASLVRAHRAAMPPPEDLIDNGPPPRREHGERPERERSPHEPRERGPRREAFDDSAWFRLNIARRQNADPRWIPPLFCCRGHVTKHAIGAIHIVPSANRFTTPSAIAHPFAKPTTHPH